MDMLIFSRRVMKTKNPMAHPHRVATLCLLFWWHVPASKKSPMAHHPKARRNYTGTGIVSFEKFFSKICFLFQGFYNNIDNSVDDDVIVF